MSAKRGHKWVSRGEHRICTRCGVEKWNPKCFHIPRDNPLWSPGKGAFGCKPWSQEPPCLPGRRRNP
jgi:hypothetical protein